MTLLPKLAIGLAAFLATGYVAGQFASRAIATDITIDAKPEAVWTVLSDTDAYADWNPFVRDLSGDLREGSRISATIAPPGGSAMTFHPIVLTANPDEELRWRGKLGVRGVFDGEHFFKLSPLLGGGTKLEHGETFRGALVPVLFPMLADQTRAGFVQMNVALKARAEAL